jgi:hypothetical protein
MVVTGPPRQGIDRLRQLIFWQARCLRVLVSGLWLIAESLSDNRHEVRNADFVRVAHAMGLSLTESVAGTV